MVTCECSENSTYRLRLGIRIPAVESTKTSIVCEVLNGREVFFFFFFLMDQ
jgi:hypothetical protein